MYISDVAFSWVRHFALLACLSGLACLPGAGVRGTSDAFDLVVIAPHPDDEVLMASGLMQATVERGGRVAVIIVTNGDSGCERDGYLREAESSAGLATLGVKAADVHFLGYPDGALRELSKTPLPAREHRDATGECTARTGTWADRSAGRVDEHTRRTGSPAEWTSTALTGDLAALLQRLQPKEIVVTHGLDDHPDHATTYLYFRRALDTLDSAPALVHRGIVHAGPCWPSATCAVYFTPSLDMPPLPGELRDYQPLERNRIDAGKKLVAIAKHVSQAGTDPRSNWLSSFARADEVFFPERYERVGGRWQRRPLVVNGYREQDTWGPDGFSATEVLPPVR